MKRKKVLIAGLVLLSVIVTLVAYFPGAHYAIVDHEMTQHREDYYVTGTVKNFGALLHHVVIVKVEWYDEDGNRIGAREDLIRDFWGKESPGYNNRTASFWTGRYFYGEKKPVDYKVWLEYGSDEEDWEYLYEDDRHWIQAAVSEYMTRPCYDYGYGLPEVPVTDFNFNTSFNVTGDEVIPGEDYYAVAICALLTSSFPQGILKTVPPSCESANGEYAGSNAEVVVPKCQANCTGHYRWLTTLSGDIASICIGSGCAAHGEDGFQGVYP